jgi:hypothetical protein
MLSDISINKQELIVGKYIVFFFSEFKDDKETVGDVILTLISLIVRNDICEMVADAGGVTLIMDVFVNYLDNEVKGNPIYVQCECEVCNELGWAGIVQRLTTG